MLELYLWVSLQGDWSDLGEPTVTVGPGAAYTKEEFILSADPLTLNWTPAEGFSYTYSIQGGPRLYYQDKDFDYLK